MREKPSPWHIVSFILTLVFLGCFVLSFLVESHASDPAGNAGLGSCTNAQVAAAQYLFLVSTPEHRPLPSVVISTSGMIRETNSSGMAAFPQLGATVGLSLGGAESSLSTQGNVSPALCFGSSYYHVLWLTMEAPNGTASSGRV